MRKGFTLVELLIVIAILAVLAVAVVVVLNPAELLRQARDSTRISDLASVNSAVALYLTDQASPTLWSGGCAAPHGNCTFATGTDPFVGVGTNGNGCGSGTANATTSVDGTGWVAVSLQSITGGSPLARLPVDPTNNAQLFYGYACGTNPGGNAPLSYEIDAALESTKYGGYTANSKDGGNNAGMYEIGNYLLQ